MLYQQLPHQRKLSEFEKVEATRLLSMKANKKIVLSSMASQSGKVIILKDLHCKNASVLNTPPSKHTPMSSVQCTPT